MSSPRLLFTQPIVIAIGFAPERRDPNSYAPSIRDPCENCGLGRIQTHAAHPERVMRVAHAARRTGRLASRPRGLSDDPLVVRLRSGDRWARRVSGEALRLDF